MPLTRGFWLAALVRAALLLVLAAGTAYFVASFAQNQGWSTSPPLVAVRLVVLVAGIYVVVTTALRVRQRRRAPVAPVAAPEQPAHKISLR